MKLLSALFLLVALGVAGCGLSEDRPPGTYPKVATTPPSRPLPKAAVKIKPAVKRKVRRVAKAQPTAVSDAPCDFFLSYGPPSVHHLYLRDVHEIDSETSYVALSGLVANTSARFTYYNVTYTCDLLDADNNKVEEGSAHIAHLAPGQTWEFTVTASSAEVRSRSGGKVSATDSKQTRSLPNYPNDLNLPPKPLPPG